MSYLSVPLPKSFGRLRCGALIAAIAAASGTVQAVPVEAWGHWGSDGSATASILPGAGKFVAPASNERKSFAVSEEDWVFSEMRDELALTVHEFSESEHLSKPSSYVDSSTNTMWKVDDGVKLTMDEWMVSGGSQRSHFVVRGGEGSSFTSTVLAGSGKTIDIAGFDEIQINGAMGSSNLNADVSVQGKKVIQTLSAMKTGDALFDIVQGYAVVGVNNHYIHADEYVLDRNVSQHQSAINAGLSKAAFYFENPAVDEPPYRTPGSLEISARTSIHLNNNAGDDAVIAGMAKNDVVFNTKDMSVRGFAGIVSGIKEGESSGAFEVHANRFRMENEGGISTKGGVYSTDATILLEANEKGELINLRAIGNPLTLKGGDWIVVLMPVEDGENVEDNPLYANNLAIGGTFVVSANSIDYGFQDGDKPASGRRPLTVVEDTASFGTTDSPIAGEIDADFAVLANLNFSGSRLRVTGDVAQLWLDGQFWGTSEMRLSDGSSFTGAVFAKTMEFSDGMPSNERMTAPFKGYFERSIWNVTGDSSAESIRINEGTLNLAYREGILPSYKTLSMGLLEAVSLKDVEETSGQGTLCFNIDLAHEAEGALDRIEAEHVSGTFVGAVHFDNAGEVSGKLFTERGLIRQSAGSMTVLNPEGRYQSGNGMLSLWTWKFLPDAQRASMDLTDHDALWSLGSTSSGENGEWVLVRVPTTPMVPLEPAIPSEVEDSFVMGSSILTATSWWSEKNDLRRRIGEVRYGTQAGAWVRVFHQKDFAGRDLGLTRRSTGVHLGYDAIVGETGDSRWLLGAAFRYADSEQHEGSGISRAEGTTDEYAVKAYAVWMNDAGWYVDPIVQVGWYDQAVDGRTNSGDGRFSADYGVWGAGASVEVGRRIELAPAHAEVAGMLSGVFIEPQAELSYFHADGGDFKLSTGMRVCQKDSDYLTGRIGAVLGKKFNYSLDPADGRYIQVALTGGFVRVFDGDNSVSYRGTDGDVMRRDETFNETRRYFGLQWDWQFRRDMRFYGDVEREIGDYYRKDYSFDLGLKVSF